MRDWVAAAAVEYDADGRPGPRTAVPAALAGLSLSTGAPRVFLLIP